MLLKKSLIFILLFGVINLYSYAQKDVTQFLGIPVDGFKTDMIKKLRDKGFTLSDSNNDVLVGEFNGRAVNIFVVTNNNKVCRIMVADANHMNETDIKIRFNKLCQQFHTNKKYLSLSDSASSKYIISDDENISYEMSIKNKRYEAIFYQKTSEYDSLITELAYERIKARNKESLDYKYDEQNSSTFKKLLDDKQYNKIVWFMINELGGEYYISMFYDNKYNQANGEDL
jgi:hypothetical protein